ncbi:SusC/RagA family TonB-linked outer membrane protein [Hymenobacter sp. HDW8]|uniref:SusC/RagA family TonB-linked outer membrane protein n=1 Tax=Hymenobacter sp. HDW8 TaxID=2714932 RepID=UPI001409C459|nr:SusC/RagA family TonB-linked outer membrane protein [Hymenobacter sp. HDW8]QIL77745.1 SusC/RagA family TonB-linked outer membrane protein [Hymenobacter sp. HDW8]
MKKFLLLLFLILAGFRVATAQDRAIQGRVTDRATGSGLPGVTVLVKGTTIGASTDSEGGFNLSVPASATTLTFSFIGYSTVERPITDAGTINVAMEASTRELGEVVVTALGLETSRDRLGTAQSTVQGQALVRSGETSPITALSGKAPGVLITRSTGDPGASANIQIRGASTITGNLQPLIVVDGIPISNTSVGENTPGSSGGIVASGGGAASNQIAGVVQQSRLNDINPDDIASMEVLRGAAAAALWGTRAANGVLVITTKKGRNADKLNLSYRTTYGIDEINQVPELQQRFGQGVNGLFSQSNARSWGDRIADRSGGLDAAITTPGAPGYQGFITFADGTQRYAIPAGTAANPHGGKNSRDTYDHSDEVFGRGYTWDNIATLSGGDQRSNFYISLGNTHTEGIARNNSDNDRTTVRVNVDRQLATKFRAGINATYARTFSNRVQQGSSGSSIFLGGLRSPADFNNAYYIGDFTDPQGNIFLRRQSSYRNQLGNSTNPGFDNPFWTIDEVRDQTRVQRLIGALELTYDATNWLNIINRTGVDTYTDRRSTVYPIGAGQSPTGQIGQSTIQETQINNDLIARATHDFSENLGGTLLVGTNLNIRRGEQVGANATNFINPFSPPQLDNTLADSRQPFNLVVEQRTAAAYAQVDLAFFNQLYLTGTGRAETASTFGPETSSTFFFPAGTLAWQFTKLAPFADNKALSFGKLRLAYGSVGVQPTPISPAPTTSQVTLTSLPMGGVPPWMRPTTAGASYAPTCRATPKSSPSAKPN